MLKIMFPYSKVAHTYFFPINFPLGEYARLFNDADFNYQDSLFKNSDELTDEQKQIQMDFLSFRMAISLNIIAVGLERYLCHLDKVLYVNLSKLNIFNWPKPRDNNWPKKVLSNPFRFYYYKISDVYKHWENVFKIKLKKPKNFKQVKDIIEFRHIWSHKAGVVDFNDKKNFQYYRINCNKLLLPSYPGFKELSKHCWNFASNTNNVLGKIVIKQLHSKIFYGDWQNDKSLFIKILNCFSWFGSLKINNTLAKRYYSGTLENDYNFEKMINTK